MGQRAAPARGKGRRITAKPAPAHASLCAKKHRRANQMRWPQRQSEEPRMGPANTKLA
jgi:hypothetical protein